MKQWIKASLHILCKGKIRIEVFIKKYYFLEMTEVLHYFTSCILLRLISSKYTGLEISCVFFFFFPTDSKFSVLNIKPQFGQHLSETNHYCFLPLPPSVQDTQNKCVIQVTKLKFPKSAICIVQNPLRNSQTEFTDSGPTNTTKTAV